MKKIIISVFLVSVLFGCALSERDLFEMNQQCLAKEKEMQEKSCISLICEISEGFYSPKTNSCLFHEIFTITPHEGHRIEIHQLIDENLESKEDFASDESYSLYVEKGQSSHKDFEEFEEVVESYK
ncbi:MAG: hypothetical protein ABIE14_01220 [Patescibacteria group bacterium]